MSIIRLKGISAFGKSVLKRDGTLWEIENDYCNTVLVLKSIHSRRLLTLSKPIDSDFEIVTNEKET